MSVEVCCITCGAPLGTEPGACAFLVGGEHAETETYSNDWAARCLRAEARRLVYKRVAKRSFAGARIGRMLWDLFGAFVEGWVKSDNHSSVTYTDVKGRKWLFTAQRVDGKTATERIAELEARLRHMERAGDLLDRVTDDPEHDITMHAEDLAERYRQTVGIVHQARARLLVHEADHVFECDHCGGVALDAHFVYDGQGGECASCGYPGMISCDSETEPYWRTSDDETACCARADCEDCTEAQGGA